MLFAKKIADSNCSIDLNPPKNANNQPVITRENLRQIFDKFDYDKSGTLNLSEFSSACYCLIDHKKLINIDIPSIFDIIDDDDTNTISFEEFCNFLDINDINGGDKYNSSSKTQNHNHLSQVFATTYIGANHGKNVKYPSPTPPPTKFDTDYVSRFWARDMGVELIPGLNGINAYIKWRFTDHARKHISCGSKIIAINSKKVDGCLFEEIVNFLNIVIITKEGFLVSFRPASLLENDRYRPNDFSTFVYDNIKDSELLKPKFDKKRSRSKSLKRLLSSKSLPSKSTTIHGVSASNNINTMDLSLEYSTTETLTEFTSNTGGDRDFSVSLHTKNISHRAENSFDSMIEQIETCRTPQCWFKFPKMVTTLLCIPKIDTISQLRQYNTHCRHCPKKSKKCRSLLHMLLDNEKYNKLSYSIQIFIMIMILISTLSYIMETIPIFNNNPQAMMVFTYTEYTVSIIFTVEYLLRIIASRNICVFFWDGLNLIDFVAIIPFWIEIISGAKGSNALRVIRVIRLARVFRLMKSPRFAEYMAILQSTLANSVGSFGIFVTLIFLEIIVASSLVYVCEAGKNGFTSIPATSWWAFVTVTTIGYGDMVPASVLGRIICVFTLFSGLLVIALPVIIIGGNFEQEYSKYIAKKAGWNAKFNKFGGANKEKEKQIKTVARLLHFINHQQCKDIFEWTDVRHLHNQGLDSFEIINRVLMFDHGHVYLPQQFSSYKKYALFEFYGKKLRNKNKYQRNKEKHMIYLLNQRRTQSQPPPSTVPTIGYNLRHTINDQKEEEEKEKEEKQEEDENANNNDKNKWKDILDLINVSGSSSSSDNGNDDGYHSPSVTAFDGDDNDQQQLKEEKKEEEQEQEQEKKTKKVLLHSQSSRDNYSIKERMSSGNYKDRTRSNSYESLMNNNKVLDNSKEYTYKFVVSDD